MSSATEPSITRPTAAIWSLKWHDPFEGKRKKKAQNEEGEESPTEEGEESPD